jgi:tetratricopeptide (TPR) repeat protein
VKSSPAVVDGTVYIGSFDNHVYALGKEEGQGEEQGQEADGWQLPGDMSPWMIVASVLGATGVGWRLYQGRSDSPTAASASTPADSDQAATDSTTAADDQATGSETEAQGDDSEAESTVESRLERAADTTEAAETAYRQNELETALTEYETAIKQYQTVLDEFTESDDRHEEVQTHLEQAKNQRQAVQEQRENRAEFSESLTAAESHFQTAIAAPTSDRVIIPRERYRQARDAYDEALTVLDESEEDLLADGVSVSPNPTGGVPPENLSKLPNIHPGAEDVLDEMELDTLTALRSADSETLNSLREKDAIGTRLGVQLTVVNYPTLLAHR